MEVANVVASIISAYGNGKDLFRRMLGKKSRKKGREATLSEEEAWLRDSLDRRPQQIRESYNSSLDRFGHRFETGDTTAHSSLAHTLLMLNSGLIALINHVLHRDAKYDPASSRELYGLSEMAASGTLAALSQLSLRLANQSSLTLKSLPPPEGEEKKRKPTKKSDKSRPGPTTVVRGAWVRPKTSSVVSTVSSQSDRKKSSHERSKSEPSLPTTKKTTKKTTSKPRTRTPSPAKHEVDTERHDNERRRRRKHHSPQRREPSMLLVPSDMFLPIREDIADEQVAPPRPPKIPLHTRPNPGRQPRPPSAATFMTASTKIGEISDRHPAYTMPARLEQQVRDPRLVQYIDEQAVSMEQKPRKIRRGFKFWKKTEIPMAVPAC